MGDAPRSRSDELAAERTDLAVTRTVLAADRTLMAWIRTSLAMISGGFGIYKFLHSLAELNPQRPRYPEGPRNLGLFLTALGAGSLLAGLIEYVEVMRHIGERRSWLRPSFFIACAAFALGLMVLIGIVIRIGPFR